MEGNRKQWGLAWYHQQPKATLSLRNWNIGLPWRLFNRPSAGKDVMHIHGVMECLGSIEWTWDSTDSTALERSALTFLTQNDCFLNLKQVSILQCNQGSAAQVLHYCTGICLQPPPSLGW